MTPRQQELAHGVIDLYRMFFQYLRQDEDASLAIENMSRETIGVLFQHIIEAAQNTAGFSNHSINRDIQDITRRHFMRHLQDQGARLVREGMNRRVFPRQMTERLALINAVHSVKIISDTPFRNQVMPSVVSVFQRTVNAIGKAWPEIMDLLR